MARAPPAPFSTRVEAGQPPYQLESSVLRERIDSRATYPSLGYSILLFCSTDPIAWRVHSTGSTVYG